MEPPGKVHLPPEGTLGVPVGSHNLVGAASIEQAMLVANWPFFGKSRRGDRPLLGLMAGLFFFSLLINLTYDFGGVWAL